MQYIKKKLQENKILAIVILVALLARILTTDKLMIFSPDEEYLAYLAQSIIKDFHIIWIGISAGSFDIYYGPHWIYIITPLLLVSHGNPVILGYFGSLLGVITAVLLYFLGKEMFGKRVGLIASIFYSTSALIVYYDQKGTQAEFPFWPL